MKKLNLWIVAALIGFLANHQCHADFFITVNSDSSTAVPNFVAGQTATISVFGHHTEGSTIDLDGFSLGFDFTAAGSPPVADGSFLPSFFKNFSATNSILSGGTLATFEGFVPSVTGDRPFVNFNVAVENRLGAPLLNLAANTKVKLFDLQFDIDAAAPTGTFGIFFTPNAQVIRNLPSGPSVRDYGIVTYDGGSFFDNQSESLKAAAPNGFQSQFSVSAVPEPSSMVLMALAGGAGAFGAWRKRRKNASAAGSDAAAV